MNNFDSKLKAIKEHINDEIKIMIFGLGSVGNYLLDYLMSYSCPNIKIIVVGRDKDKMQNDVNIVKVASLIRQQNKSEIIIEGGCNFNEADSIAEVIAKHQPHIIVNSSRVYSGLKYGSISWHKFRAYGIWVPLAVKYIKNISVAIKKAENNSVLINTSYSDAVNPWLKSAGELYPDFGSGNLNHLIPRIKFAASKIFNIKDFYNIDVSLATSHFHDVVISKEGHNENLPQLLKIKYNGEYLKFSQEEILSLCNIPMPTDQKRNMMNASSNFEIILAILNAAKDKKITKVHCPGVQGEIGGYPYIINGESMTGYIDESEFSLEQMSIQNKKSIYLDGIESVENGAVAYTDKLINCVKTEFNVELPKKVQLAESDKIAEFIIENIIKKAG